ncbi:hypothetical protein CR513_32384, partial [Mucuna pruriens]
MFLVPFLTIDVLRSTVTYLSHPLQAKLQQVGPLRIVHSAYWGTCPIVHAELWAIFQGLQLPISRGLRSIVVESDSQVIINLIKSKKQSMSQLDSSHSP